jgi:hypothetical protein
MSKIVDIFVLAFMTNYFKKYDIVLSVTYNSDHFLVLKMFYWVKLSADIN